MTKQEVAALQREINKTTGFNLTVDGRYGPKTEEAYQFYINQRTPASVETPVPPAPIPWWQSKTAIFTLATIIVSIASLAGFDIDKSQLTEVIASALTLVTGLLALWSNARRRAPLDRNLLAPGLRIPTGAPVVQPKSETDIQHLRGPFGY